MHIENEDATGVAAAALSAAKDRLPDGNDELETGTSLAEDAFGLQDADAAPASTGYRSHSLDDLREKVAAAVLTQDEQQPFTLLASPFVNPATGQPFRVPLVYCDHTASNRAVSSIERYVHDIVLPLYGNTHTTTCVTGAQTTALCAESRQIVAEFMHARVTGKASVDVVLWAGQGATSAVELLIDCVGIAHMAIKPVVYVGPWEHHSNLIPWREAGCTVVNVPEAADGSDVDLEQLAILLQDDRFAGRIKIGAFAAASNVTGQLCNVTALASTLHQYGALCFVDYATAAPYCIIDMNPVSYPTAALDACYWSAHKLLGGVGGTGVLVVKKNLVSRTNAPRRSGGGTVFYATSDSHRFLSNRSERYEGGTPNVPGIVRTGLALLLKRQVEQEVEWHLNQANAAAKSPEPPAALSTLTASSTDGSPSVAAPPPSDELPPRTLLELDCQSYRQAAAYLRQHARNLVLLSEHHPTTLESSRRNLPILSFLIRHGDRFLHYNYVCAVLNDVFGIQSRGGCQCAGPYSQKLLGLTGANNAAIEELLVHGKGRAELWRPGYTRLSLPFKGQRAAEVDYVLWALAWISRHGWALLCQYRCNHRTGEWRHASRQGSPLGKERRWLSRYSVFDPMSVSLSSTTSIVSPAQMLDQARDQANDMLQSAISCRRSIAESLKVSQAGSKDLDEADMESLRWFTYPWEVAELLQAGISEAPDSQNVVGALYPLAIRGMYPRAKRLHSQVEQQRKLPSSTSVNVVIKESYPEGAFQFDVDGVNETRKAKRLCKNWGNGTNTLDLDCRKREDSVEEKPASSQQMVLRRHVHVRPPNKVMRLVTQAVMQWEMLEDGDKLLLGLSGGKDSLSMLHCLLELRRKLPISFQIQVCTVDPMTSSFDPSPLIPYIEAMGLQYHFIRDDIVNRATTAGKAGKNVSSLCAYCARMKRGNLYSTARANGCNKLVLAQHLDDCAESLVMSLMHNGLLRTMKANYRIDAGDISVIRPFVYCRESILADFAKSSKLPVINENCPACFEEPKERARIKKMLAREESLFPNLYDNMRRALVPLMHDGLSDVLKDHTKLIVDKDRAKSRSTNDSNSRGAGCKKRSSLLSEGDRVEAQKSVKSTAQETSEDKCIHSRSGLTVCCTMFD